MLEIFEASQKLDIRDSRRESEQQNQSMAQELYDRLVEVASDKLGKVQIEVF